MPSYIGAKWALSLVAGLFIGFSFYQADITQAGMMPPFLLRLKDDEARHIANSLIEILNSPRDARISHGDH